MANVGLLDNKMDELAALVKNRKSFIECSVLCFTERWLHETIPDSSINTDSLLTWQAVRNHTISWTEERLGRAIFINNRWCHPGHIVTSERVCSPDSEI